ncbi:MAG TPA: 3'-5' exonuclease [Candidatus Paceibacterota bacterium]|nr:3'-5' exonuclease [Candidatus Paceibacterota bacterium]
MTHPEQYEADTRLKERPLAFVDLEFTGLQAHHEILQIGCVLVSQPDLNVIREWQVRVKPEHIGDADPKALELVGYSEEVWSEAVPLKDALTQFNEVVNGAVLVGFNVVWDVFFLKKSYAEVRVAPTFHWQVLDVLSMAFLELYDSDLKGFRMRELVHRFAMPEQQKWHDAFIDARATLAIYRELKRMENDHA